MDLAALVAEHLPNTDSGWSIGGFGAIGEFHHARDVAAKAGASGVASPLGALSLALDDEVRAIAYEVPAGAADYWHHGIVLCAPAARARITEPGRIEALGPDAGALFADEARAPLFDLGVGAPTFRFCVRAADADLAGALHSVCGLPFERVADVLGPRLVKESPTRVVLCAIGRIEVRQPIAAPDGRTPEGPHTHLIPALLRNQQTHSRNVPVPAGMLPLVTLYPAHPLVDGEGRRKPFDARQHADFQALLARFGDPPLVAAKQAVVEGVRAGRAPAPSDLEGSRHMRLARRVALRQLSHLGWDAEAIAAWRSACEAPGHRSARYVHLAADHLA